jgi:hypothetical protein
MHINVIKHIKLYDKIIGNQEKDQLTNVFKYGMC